MFRVLNCVLFPPVPSLLRHAHTHTKSILSNLDQSFVVKGDAISESYPLHAIQCNGAFPRLRFLETGGADVECRVGDAYSNCLRDGVQEK